MDTVKLNAYAKINLLLDVIKKRPDGYHELEGIMQSISLCDELVLTRADDISVECGAPLPHMNTCRKAAEAFLAGSGRGVHIAVKKHIPSEAGLGGASADGAAVLRGLNELYRGTELYRTEEELLSLGLGVGADVPFCMTGGCAVARGVGEILDSLPPLRLDLLIVRGSRGVSTARLFKSLGVGSEPGTRIPDGSLARAIGAIKAGDVRALSACLANALRPEAENIAPEIAGYAAEMLRAGALGASMTGSGAAVFGVFPDHDSAKKAAERFRGCEFVCCCETLERI